MDIERESRKISACLHVEVVITTLDGKTTAEVDDREHSGRTFNVDLGKKHHHINRIRALHEDVYHARARKKYEMQGGRCANPDCRRWLRGQGETDHIVSRGAHGRDDSISNLAVYCARLTGGCTYHHDKHSKGKST